MRYATLIASARSRDGVMVSQRAREALPERGVDIVQSLVVPDSRAALKAVRRAISSGSRLVLVAGGDGALTTVVRAFAGTDAVLGVLPAGTGNSFAMGLGIRSLEDALEAIATGHEARVDLGVVNGRYFANFATIGFASVAAGDAATGIKKLFGPVAYAIGAVRALRRAKPFRMSVKWEQNAIDFPARQAIIANGRYYGHMPLLPSARIDDGQLAFFATASPSVLDLVRTNAALVRGTQTLLSNAQFFSARKIRIKCSPRQPVAVDGERFGKTPVTFSVERKALRVLVSSAAGENA